uniref:F-box domain-containing protein n=1 Tax=Kalanchoe fedtschenkoi TaxID=63787 RepID=A0A7N0TTZ9_KALFE
MPDLCKDLVYEILLRCPVKSLLRFKSVSKQWSEIISSRSFTSDHLRAHRRAAASHLISYPTSAPFLTVNQYEGEGRPFKLDLPIHHPGDVSMFGVRSSCRGLLCAVVSTVSDVKMFVLNPITRAVKELPACPDVTQQMISLSLVSVGLGYDPDTDDYKVVAVILPKRIDTQSQQPCRKISILSLKSNVWDQSIEDPAPYNAVGTPTSLDGHIYWLGLRGTDLAVMRFDLARRKFTVIRCPPEVEASFKKPLNSSERFILFESGRCGRWLRLVHFAIMEDGIRVSVKDSWLLFRDEKGSETWSHEINGYWAHSICSNKSIVQVKKERNSEGVITGYILIKDGSEWRELWRSSQECYADHWETLVSP